MSSWNYLQMIVVGRAERSQSFNQNLFSSGDLSNTITYEKNCMTVAKIKEKISRKIK